MTTSNQKVKALTEEAAKQKRMSDRAHEELKRLTEERQRLTDSNRELKNAASDAIATLNRWLEHDPEGWDARDDETVKNLNSAINNAKNINHDTRN